MRLTADTGTGLGDRSAELTTLADVREHAVVVVELDVGGLCGQGDLDGDSVGIHPDTMGDRWSVVEVNDDRDRHAETIGHVFLPDLAMQYERVTSIRLSWRLRS